MKLISKFLILFSFLSIFALSNIVFCSVIYKDINSISIRTNIQIDYETVQMDGVPDLTYNSQGYAEDMIYVYDTAKYEIESCEWYSSNTDDFEIGGTPKIAVYLITKDYENNYYNYNDYYYRFLSSYSKSTCFISNGTFVSATRLSTSNLKIVFALDGLKGTYYAPENAYWSDDYGTARWDAPTVCNSGYYDLILYRDSSVVARIDKYQGNTYNFSSYFTKEGSYSFKVRTVPGTDNQSLYGKNSEYTESGDMTVDASIVSKVLSNGGLGGNTSGSGNSNVGWIKLNNTWTFRAPNGQMLKNQWVKWQNNWYYLDYKGEMKVGFQTIDGRTYYLSSDGAMIAGWINLNDTFYYFDTSSGDNYGAMLISSWVKYDNKYFYFDENGVMVTGWKQIIYNNVPGYYYFYPKGSTQGLYGYMAANTTINGFQLNSDGMWIQN